MVTKSKKAYLDFWNSLGANGIRDYGKLIEVLKIEDVVGFGPGVMTDGSTIGILVLLARDNPDARKKVSNQLGGMPHDFDVRGEIKADDAGTSGREWDKAKKDWLAAHNITPEAFNQFTKKMMATPGVTGVAWGSLDDPMLPQTFIKFSDGKIGVLVREEGILVFVDNEESERRIEPLLKQFGAPYRIDIMSFTASSLRK